MQLSFKKRYKFSLLKRRTSYRESPWGTTNYEQKRIRVNSRKL